MMDDIIINKKQVDQYCHEILENIENYGDIDNVGGIASFFDIKWLQHFSEEDIEKLLRLHEISSSDANILLLITYYYGYKKDLPNARKYFDKWLLVSQPLKRIHCFIYAIITNLDTSEGEILSNNIKLKDIDRYRDLYIELCDSEPKNKIDFELGCRCFYYYKSDFFMLGQFYESEQEYLKAKEMYEKALPYDGYIDGQYYVILINFLIIRFKDFKTSYKYSKDLIALHIKENEYFENNYSSDFLIQLYKILLMFNDCKYIEKLTQKLQSDYSKYDTELKQKSNIHISYLIHAFLSYNKRDKKISSKYIRKFKKWTCDNDLQIDYMTLFTKLAPYFNIGFFNYAMFNIIPEWKYFQNKLSNHRMITKLIDKIQSATNNQTYLFESNVKEWSLIKQMFTYDKWFIWNKQNATISISDNAIKNINSHVILIEEYIAFLHRIIEYQFTTIAHNLRFFYDMVPEKDKKLIENKDDMLTIITSLKMETYEYSNFILKTSYYETEQKIFEAKLAERDKIIADMSHRIKNILNKLASPLRQLKGSENAITINKALKGADLIREIINGFNYSYSGSFDDFIFDANNKGGDAGSFENILINSILPAVENMFDGKWFKTFLDQYFPDRESFTIAKNAWNNSNLNAISSLEEFCNHYLFDCELKTENIEQLKIGNKKGSEMKFMILFQELILNAVKYSSFVKRDMRFLKIEMNYKTGNGLTFKISNSFDPDIQEKETGLGHVIIETMCKLMHAEYKKTPDPSKNVFTIAINFPDYWQQRNISNKVFYRQDSDIQEYPKVSESIADYKTNKHRKEANSK